MSLRNAAATPESCGHTVVSSTEEWAYTCWECADEMPSCSTERERDRKARQLGWGMCLDQTGQAHVICDSCLPGALNPVKFGPISLADLVEHRPDETVVP